jgi:lysine 2,3-aminomutase
MVSQENINRFRDRNSRQSDGKKFLVIAAARRQTEFMWNDELTNSIRSPEAAAALLHLSGRSLKAIGRAAEQFPIIITPYYFDLIDPSNPKDPIRRQVIPSPGELWIMPGETRDPLNESSFSPEPGLIQKYRNRVLVQITGRCAVHCRFCFRKHLKNTQSDLSLDDIIRIANYIRRRKAVQEIILSGGDPLMADDAYLDRVIGVFSELPYIEILRIHTRMPVVLPQRITSDLIQLLKRRFTPWIVTHFNHPRELTSEAIDACSRLIDNGIPVLNQSVLLRGINDNVKTLTDLCSSLVRSRIKPYYLHLLDPAPGTFHFRVSNGEAVRMVAEMQSRLAGYAIPLLVKDSPGAVGKRPVFTA